MKLNNLTSDNKVINGLWVGNKLSYIEILTLSSFVKHGHSFNLWVYEDIETPIPCGVSLKDANEIIGGDQIFYYKNPNQYKHGKGSIAGFSDIFRYMLLYKKGGWWVDMDVTCIKPLNFEDPYVFRAHDVLPIVGNVMKCPIHSPLMLDCFKDATANVDADNRDWFKPIKILSKHVFKHRLHNSIRVDLGPPDSWNVINVFRQFPVKNPGDYYIVHWLNEEWRHRGIAKNDIINNSFLGNLMIEYRVVKQESLKARNLKDFDLKSQILRVQYLYPNIYRMIPPIISLIRFFKDLLLRAEGVYNKYVRRKQNN
ncbi:MAG: glycosyltransferase [Cyclobacteriaceae bacterium]